MHLVAASPDPLGAGQFVGQLHAAGRAPIDSPQAVLIVWREVDPGHGGVLEAAGVRQYDDRRKRAEPIGLNVDGGRGLPLSPCKATRTMSPPPISRGRPRRGRSPAPRIPFRHGPRRFAPLPMSRDIAADISPRKRFVARQVSAPETWRQMKSVSLARIFCIPHQDKACHECRFRRATRSRISAPSPRRPGKPTQRNQALGGSGERTRHPVTKTPRTRPPNEGRSGSDR